MSKQSIKHQNSIGLGSFEKEGRLQRWQEAASNLPSYSPQILDFKSALDRAFDFRVIGQGASPIIQATLEFHFTPAKELHTPQLLTDIAISRTLSVGPSLRLNAVEYYDECVLLKNELAIIDQVALEAIKHTDIIRAILEKRVLVLPTPKNPEL